ncbi:hypothetical protein FE634_11075 [Nocardioides dongxiaopingii]|uniref:hypothetical protein n=1 Tax=Nocardioides sp. S-1144 TaxID=2582905 RepID=UPI00110F1EEB|nr:hypothetical protein [Nocardioides sp. S-1144]QCW50817.1 hypothetical protein FE634_11075 [Nocardioides sp. S-1144]
MTWLGLLLVGIGVTDLVYSWTRRPRTAEAAAAATVVVLGLLAGAGSLGPAGAGGAAGLLAVAVAAVAWGESVTHGFGARRYGRPLLVLAVAVVAAVLASAAPVPAGGVLADWLEASGLPVLSGLAGDPGRAVLVAGGLLVQLSTGNVVVRLVLGATGTTHPLRSTAGAAPALKGGRLLGPMERVFILGLGLAGEVTAASVVIAAKGLLRFPELQAARDPATRARGAGAGPPEPGIHEVTEYFLVGSFVSWTVSLVSLALTAT